MNGAPWTRWSPAAGLTYAVLYVVGFFLIVKDELDEKSDADLVSYYADSGNRTGDIVGLLLVAISLLFFLLFVSALRERLRTAGDEGGLLSSGESLAVPFERGAAARLLLSCSWRESPLSRLQPSGPSSSTSLR